MRFKISPEVIRLATILAAGVQAFTAVLTGTDVLPSNVLVIVVAAGAFLQGMAAAYSQGVQTNPPEGMLTEERARELATPAADVEPREWPSMTLAEVVHRAEVEAVKSHGEGGRASGRATVGVVTRPDETSGLGV